MSKDIYAEQRELNRRAQNVINENAVKKPAIRLKVKKLSSGYYTIVNQSGAEVLNTLWETKRAAQYDMARMRRAMKAGKTFAEYTA